MTLEARAARAVRSIQQSVSTTTPVPVGLVVRRQRTSLVGVLAGAGAVAALTFAVAVSLPASVDQVTDGVANERPIIPSEPTPTVPKDPAPPVVVPVDKTYPPASEDGVYQHNATSSEASAFAKFFGTGAPGTTVTATSEYGSATTKVGSTGQFVLKVHFTDPPFNVAFPVTVSIDGETHAFTFTSLWDPDEVAVTASRTYGGSSSSSPYDIYFGSAPAGTTVTASSPYGSGSTTANSKGQWSLKVWFTGAPSGTAFAVNVNVGGQVFPFWFTATQAPAPTTVTVNSVHKDEGQGQWMKFFLSGPAGTVVEATSPYGSASIQLQGKPEEYLKVFFAGAPLGGPFQVTLTVNGAAFGSPHQFTSSWDPANTPIEIWVHKDEHHPYFKATGTAPPGTEISVTSAYGSLSGTVNGTGSYQLKLEGSSFNPPANEAFDITVTVGEVVQVHQFTYQPS